jgi:PKHD-type hydroxylase
MLSILDNVLSQAQVQEVLARVSEEGFEDGKATAGYRAKLVKDNQQQKKDAPGLAANRELILAQLRKHPGFRTAAYARTIRPILISRYKPGMQYGMHVDDPLMGGERKERTDVAMTLFLSAPDSYEGGELFFESPWGAQEIKLPAGSAVLYPASTLHRVNPVTAGERIAAVTWIQSYVRDPAQRELLAEIDRIRAHLHKTAPDAPETNLAFKAYSNLLRMWAET